jgi:hypothetical protein
MSQLAARLASSPGDACCCSDVAMECRYASGTATVCGFNEFIPTSPPKKYKRWQSHMEVFRAYGNCPDGHVWVINRTEIVTPLITAPPPGPLDPTQYTVIDGCVMGYNGFGDTTNCLAPALSGPGYGMNIGDRETIRLCEGPLVPLNRSSTYATARSVPGTYGAIGCCPAQLPCYIGDGYCFGQLSDEDTEDAAESRARVNLSWSDWYSHYSYCDAYRTKRTSGFSFGFKDVQYRLGVVVKGTTMNSLDVAVDLFRTPHNTSLPPVLTATVVHSIPISTDPEAMNWSVFDVPNSQGYTTSVRNPRRWV